MADSFLETAITRIRFAADEPAESSKYSDSELIKHFIEPGYSDVVNDITMTSNASIISSFTLSIVADQEFYVLPPNIRKILQIAQYDDSNQLTNTWVPLSFNNLLGPRWLINGNTLQVRPLPTVAETWYMLYEPSGDIRLHKGTVTASGSVTTGFTLDSSPDLGTMDRRANAYVGSALTILSRGGTDGSTDAEIETRIIASHTAAGVITFREALATTITDTTIFKYEIGPLVGPGFQDVWAMRAALKLLAFKGASASSYNLLQLEYRRAIKTIRDNMANMNAVTGNRFQSDTIENNDPYGPNLYMF